MNGFSCLFISQFHNLEQSLKVKLSGGPLDNQTWHANGWLQQKLKKFDSVSYSHNCTLASGAFFHSVCQV